MRKCRGKVIVGKNGEWHEEEFELGFFHQWGIDYEFLGSDLGFFSAAIVELPDGRIITPHADKIQFLEPIE